jgi:hypothetical protein
MKNLVKFFTLAGLLFLFSPEMKAQATSNGNGNGQNNSNDVVTYVTGIVLSGTGPGTTFVYVDGVAFSPANLDGLMQAGRVCVGDGVTLRIITSCCRHQGGQGSVVIILN